ncbi:MAG: hypothetical protein ACYS80_07050 [Planctomycetota bacterium]
MTSADGPSPLTFQLRSQLPKFLQDVQVDMRGSAPELILGRAAIKDCANYKVLGRLSMYERRIENSMFKTMRELERLRLMRQMQEKDAAEEQSALESCSPADQKVNYAKQSQFVTPQIGVNSMIGENYENISACEVQKNKAKQSQSQAFGAKFGALNSKT